MLKIKLTKSNTITKMDIHGRIKTYYLRGNNKLDIYDIKTDIRYNDFEVELSF